MIRFAIAFGGLAAVVSGTAALTLATSYGEAIVGILSLVVGYVAAVEVWQ